MFDSLAQKFQDLFTPLRGKKTLTEDNVSDAVRKVRLALLDADVNYSVASQFVKRVKEKALGETLLKSVKADELFIKIVHDELVALMGGDEPTLKSEGVMLLCGLQGSGKTTTAVKLAAYVRKEDPKKKILIAACDLARPAAITQLMVLGEKAGIDVFTLEGANSPVRVAKKAHEKMRKEGYDLLIVDTAGRLHIDEALMKELSQVKEELNPQEVLFVANATTGQDAVKTAQEFDRLLTITGSILTMLDGNARAGSALSIMEITKKPLKFEGIGEKIEDFQLFNPKSMADRVLGMGDVINLVKRAEEHIDEEESKRMEKKLRKAAFTYDDYLKQMGMIKKMGSLKGILKMLPGVPDMGDMDLSEKEFKQTEAMILSMTQKERAERAPLIPSRRRRIASGSGTSLDAVNRMVKSFKQLKKLCKSLPKNMKGIPNLKQKQMEKSLWQ
ncbi:MAG: Signal recognition particle protein [Chlamydiae bacterium]|nr:Signal recognition particle protein [Chlamydiota bacterium]